MRGQRRLRADLHEPSRRAAVQLRDGDTARGRQELQGQVLRVWGEMGEGVCPETEQQCGEGGIS